MATDRLIEQEIQAKGLTAPRIKLEDIDEVIDKEYYFSAASAIYGNEAKVSDLPLGLTQVIFCLLILKNGHRIVGVSEGPISPSNFDEGIGKNLARQKAVDQIWPLLGYPLREEIYQNNKAPIFQEPM